MSGMGTPWAFLFQHPIVGLIVFAAVSGGVVFAMSGGRLAASLLGILRVAVTIFTTPFVFLRDALTVVRATNEAEQDYAQSSVFVLFRFNRIQYMALLVLSLLILSGGVTSSILMLYPQAEIARSRALSAEIAQLETEIAAANEAAATASAPGFREGLAARRDEARTAHQAQVQSNATFAQSTTFSGAAIDQLAAAQSSENAAYVRDNIDTYMSGCPRAWRNMTAESCAQYRAFVLEMADRKINELNLAQAADEAERAWRDADASAQSAGARLSDAQARLEFARQALTATSPFNPKLLAQRAWAAFLILLATLWSVIVTIWVGALLIDLLRWLILMMRSLEKSQSDKLTQSRSGQA
jgi:hypothetical protein